MKDSAIVGLPRQFVAHEVFFECESAGVALLKEEKQFFADAAEKHSDALEDLEIRYNNRCRKIRVQSWHAIWLNSPVTASATMTACAHRC